MGVGSGEAASEFAQQLGVEPAICFGDDNGDMYDALGAEQGFKTMWNPPAVDSMMARNDQASLTALGQSYKAAVDNIGFKRLAPPDIKDTLRQGGTFVFRGAQPVLEHYDTKVGNNCEIDVILTALQR